jgi:hypothetical protein
MYRALYQCTLDIEELVIHPIQWRAGMRTTIAVAKAFAITLYDETIDACAGAIQRKPVRTGIRQAFLFANKG